MRRFSALALTIVAGCGYTIADARRDITVAARAQIELVHVYEDFNLSHQRAIVAAAHGDKTKEDRALAEYRATQPKVEAGFASLAATTRAVKDELDAAGSFKIADIVAPLFRAAEALYLALEAVGLDARHLRTLGTLIGRKP